MANQSVVDTVAYCGLVCAVCRHARSRCRDCRNGGGEDECYHRQCCVKKNLDGCWQCEGFPCDKGFFADEAWRGLNIGCTQAVKEHGVEAFVRIVKSRLGETVEYGDYRFKEPEEIRAMLQGDRDT